MIGSKEFSHNFLEVGKRKGSRFDEIMGYTMRTSKYRYTEWVHFTDKPKYMPKWEKVVGIELYDHDKDPEENVNVVNQQEYKIIAQGLSKLLHKGWRNTLPYMQY